MQHLLGMDSEAAEATPEIVYRDYPQEVLDEMRRLGMPKPIDCHSDIWRSRKELDRTNIEATYSTIIELLLLGWSKKKIAETLGVHYTSITDLTNSASFRSAMSVARKERSDTISKDILTKLYQPAVETLEQLILNGKDQIRLQAAIYAIDQSVGKPEAKVHHTGNVISEVLHHIEELKSREVTPASETSSAPIDPMESFVNEFIDTDFKVGKRDQGSQE